MGARHTRKPPRVWSFQGGAASSSLWPEVGTVLGAVFTEQGQEPGGRQWEEDRRLRKVPPHGGHEECHQLGDSHGETAPPDQRTRDGSRGPISAQHKERGKRHSSECLPGGPPAHPAFPGAQPTLHAGPRVCRSCAPTMEKSAPAETADHQGGWPADLRVPLQLTWAPLPWVCICTREVKSDPTKCRQMTRPLRGGGPGEVSWLAWDK